MVCGRRFKVHTDRIVVLHRDAATYSHSARARLHPACWDEVVQAMRAWRERVLAMAPRGP
jgi:hypothetical protein